MELTRKKKKKSFRCTKPILFFQIKRFTPFFATFKYHQRTFFAKFFFLFFFFFSIKVDENLVHSTGHTHTTCVFSALHWFRHWFLMHARTLYVSMSTLTLEKKDRIFFSKRFFFFFHFFPKYKFTQSRSGKGKKRRIFFFSFLSQSSRNWIFLFFFSLCAILNFRVRERKKIFFLSFDGCEN